ncbi:hypothetical protein HD554DRAFT_1191864 [Boletus coccyginus]|nr:hypothetical protein HD554DRAFT_1191864 [Boletus coccyginus]
MPELTNLPSFRSGVRTAHGQSPIRQRRNPARKPIPGHWLGIHRSARGHKATRIITLLLPSDPYVTSPSWNAVEGANPMVTTGSEVVQSRRQLERGYRNRFTERSFSTRTLPTFGGILSDTRRGSTACIASVEDRTLVIDNGYMSSPSWSTVDDTRLTCQHLCEALCYRMHRSSHGWNYTVVPAPQFERVSDRWIESWLAWLLVG